MKKVLLLAVLGLSFGLAATSCSKDNEKDKPVVTGEVYTMDNPTNKAELDKIKAEFAQLKEGNYAAVNIASDAKVNIVKWAKEYAEVKALETEATEGKAGFLPDGKKKRYVSGKAVEPNQLIAKGLIGAYQLYNFATTGMAALKAQTAKERAEILNKCVVYLLGDLKFGKTIDDFKAEGNSFGKYMMVISEKGKYAGIAKQLEAEITKAYTLVNDKNAFIASLSKIGETANLITAFRGVHYIAGYTAKLREEGGFTGKNVHELSEGLGFIYSLQFAYNYEQHGTFMLSAEDAKAITEVNLWEEAKKSADDSKLDKMAEQVAGLFGFTVAEAKA